MIIPGSIPGIHRRRQADDVAGGCREACLGFLNPASQRVKRRLIRFGVDLIGGAAQIALQLRDSLPLGGDFAFRTGDPAGEITHRLRAGLLCHVVVGGVQAVLQIRDALRLRGQLPLGIRHPTGEAVNGRGVRGNTAGCIIRTR